MPASSESHPADEIARMSLEQVRIANLPPAFSRLVLRVYYSGEHFVDSQCVEGEVKSGEVGLSIAGPLYRERAAQKAVFLLLDCRLTEDTLVGRRQVLFADLCDGTQTVRLGDGGTHPAAELTFALKTQGVPGSQLTILQGELHLASRYWQSSLFLRVRIGSRSERTETARLHPHKRTFLFHKTLRSVFSSEQTLEVELYDEDISTYELLGVGRAQVQDLAGAGTAKVRLLPRKAAEDIGAVSFEYSLKWAEGAKPEGKESDHRLDNDGASKP